MASTAVAPPLAAPLVAAGSPFDFDESAVDTPVATARRRPKKSSSWVGLAVVGLLLATMVTLGVVFRSRLSSAVNTIATGKADDTEDEEPTKPGKAAISPGKGSNVPVPLPRRALVISVHNYLYANPIPDVSSDSKVPTVHSLIHRLGYGLKISTDQIIHLSDAAKKEPRPPLKSVIEETLVNFLKTSRKQDRIMVFFIGHGKEVNDEAYLVPLEGEFEDAKTLIPLSWVYKQLADCPARQKVLVIDANRFNSAQGEERPPAGPMGAKFAAALKSPPVGVQVLASCSAGELSHELEEAPLGLYLNSLRMAMDIEKGGALAGTIQKANDLIPIEKIQKVAEQNMAKELTNRKLKQVTTLAGSPPASGADFDRSEGPAKMPALPVLASADTKLVNEIMSEISLPPLKAGSGNSQDVSFSILPPFPAEVLKGYTGGDLPDDSELRKAIREAQVILWAVSSAKPPKELKAEVDAYRSRVGVDLSETQDRRYTKPAAGTQETAFKTRVFEESKALSKIVAKLENALEKLKDAGEQKETAPKRWQANYALILARLQATLAYLEEYQSLLGSMRKEYPQHDPAIHSGWKMASKEKASDSLGKKLDRAARKLYADLAKDNPKTPYEVLGKREKLTALGLEWQAY